MVKAKASDVKKQVKQQDDELYQDALRDDPESDDDTEKAVEDTYGMKIKPGEEFDIAKEVDRDEKARRTKPKISKD